MEWGLVALIISALVYIGRILVEYTHFVVEIKPVIQRLVTRGLELDELVKIEMREVMSVRERIDRFKPGISNLHHAIIELRRNRDEELTRQQRLEMVVLKNRLRRIHRLDSA